MYSDLLQCNIEEIQYNFEARQGALYFPKNNCCDMSGAIKFVSKIDKKVEMIQTFCDNKPDTIYGKINGTWEARIPRQTFKKGE